MQTLKKLWLHKNSKEDGKGGKTRERSNTSTSKPNVDPLDDGRSRSNSAVSSSHSSYNSHSYNSGTDSEPEPFQLRPNNVLVAATPSFFQDDITVTEVQLEQEGDKKKKEKDRSGRDRDKKKDDKGRDRERHRDKKDRHQRHGDRKRDDKNECDQQLLDSQKGDFDPEQDEAREVIYIDSLADFSEDILKILKKSQIPEEKFEKNFDILLRVLTFVSKQKKAYRRRNGPDLPKREKYEHIFISPGKYYKYPEELDVAKDKLCIQEDPKPYIKFGEFEGKGGFGRVFAGRLKNPHNASEKERIAVKIMPHKTEKEMRMNLSEVGLVSYFKHPNIVKFHRCYLHNEELWVLMEFLEGGTLKEATHNFQFAESHIAYVAREMLKGIVYLHNQNIAHRDLKSANVMMSMKGEVKLIDFGLCADFTELKEMRSMCGSPFWMPPEMIANQNHTLKADIWSLGVCLVEMMERKVPHRSTFKAMFLAASEGIEYKDKPKYSPAFVDMLDKCLQLDPNNRATAIELFQHPFLQKAASLKQMQTIMPAIFLSNTMTRQGIL